MEAVEKSSGVIDKDGDTEGVEESAIRNLDVEANVTLSSTEAVENADVLMQSENAGDLETLTGEETQVNEIALASTNESSVDPTISEIADENADNEEAMEVSPTAESAKNKIGRSTLHDESEESMNANVTETCSQDKIDDANDGNGDDTETTTVESRSTDNLIKSVEKINDNDSTSQDSNVNSENPVFVHVNTEKEDNEKSSTNIDQDEPDVDPIGSSDWTQNVESESRNGEEPDEAECIIPDTNRVLTQEEKDSATNIRDPSDAEQPSNTSNSEVELPAESENPDWKGKYVVNICTGEFLKKCMICSNESKTKYTCTLGRKQTFICSEVCLKKLKEENVDKIIIRDLRVKNFAPQEVDNLMPTYGDDSRHCTDCGMIIRNKENLLSWETLDYCSETCLTKYQKRIGSYCSNCNLEVSDNFLGKYCVRFGYNIRQFCSSSCLEEYKKGLKVCAYCQEDMSGNSSGFLASIGDKGMFRDFCSADCMEKYNSISKNRKSQVKTCECCVCHKVKPIEIELESKSKTISICSDPCFVAYKFVNNICPEKCDMCAKHTLKQILQQNSIVYDGQKRRFCSKTCQNIYITTHRKIVSCCWCKVKKYNFDMIQKATPTGDTLMICSLNCLNLYQVSVSASKAKKKLCDNCHKTCKGQYHMTAGDTAVKNFCSYPCVQEYQSKYTTEIRIGPSDKPTVPAPSQQTITKRMTRKTAIKTLRKQIIPDVPGPLPIITSVRSLAKQSSPGCLVRALRSKALPAVPGLAPLTNSFSTELLAPPPLPPAIKNIIVIRPPDLPLQRNVATLVKPITIEISIDVKPLCFDKAVQTDDLKDSLEIVPIPVPIYVPSPVHMFSLPFAVPVPFPLPIPVPIFIPTTKNTANGLFKEIKKSQVRTPTDPYEADLLMMAEMVAVAGEKKEENEESESEVDNEDTAVPEEATFSPEPQDASNTFGDDMLQMALKMATDFEEPPVDLEGALTASTITATAGNEQSVEEQVDDPQPVQLLAEKSTFRGRRRGRPYRHGGRGRGRGRPPTQVQPPVLPSPEPTQPTEPVEKPDANMCLKYTFGVNAWKQWVTTKNAELEKTSRRVKLFKTEILQLTSDELNYSLCLFVKEVRKPNGAEYAPDTIYYLCLGIQQYLFENGRIDNIFCDSYYEKFTDCLDEVCKKFSSLYNDSQYIVTRVEEEHLWESKQLGAHSPHVLLSTLMFFNTKHFNLTTVDEHMQLSFSHIMKHWKRVPNQPGVAKSTGSRNILLRFYPPQSAIEGNMRKKKVYEQQENEENPLRCPVKLYEFYLSKCPESVKTRNDVFYLLPERSCVPDSPVWYSTMALGKDALEKMLHRVKMVKEINVALLAS